MGLTIGPQSYASSLLSHKRNGNIGTSRPPEHSAERYCNQLSPPKIVSETPLSATDFEYENALRVEVFRLAIQVSASGGAADALGILLATLGPDGRLQLGRAAGAVS
mmetsp:Transcript_56825/g.149686  ORF Transcript_56825/g.149686 Transcript_56825/m.149686 type:complete len:107 (-) Transcript_56825:96-416(-)